jgi:thioesterase domain-containing protein
MAEFYANTILHVLSDGGTPIYLAGYSVGGLIAYETACVLRKRGRAVEKLFLISPSTPPSLRKSIHNAKENMARSAQDFSTRFRKYLSSPLPLLGRLKRIARNTRAHYYASRGELRPYMAWDHLEPIYKKAIRAHVVQPYVGDTLLIAEKGFCVDAWLSVLKGRYRLGPVLDCSHLSIHKPEASDEWLPTFLSELDGKEAGR